MKPEELQKIKKIRDTLKAATERRRFRKLDFFIFRTRNKKEFHSLGAAKRERLLMAGNRQGKTYCGAARRCRCTLPANTRPVELSRRFTKPVNAWVCGESSVLVRNTPQVLLCGKYGVDAEQDRPHTEKEFEGLVVGARRHRRL